MSDDDNSSPDSFRKSLAAYFNTPSVAPIVGSSIVILGAFLNWTENPLAATTGIGSGIGYITISIAIFVLLLSYWDRYRNKRIILSFLSSVLLLLITSNIILSIVIESQVRLGGGIYLTILGTIIILVGSLRSYSDLTSPKRAATMVGVTLFLLALLPGILLSGAVIDEYQKDKAEKDLKSLEINEVNAHIIDNSGEPLVEESDTPTAEVNITNPTDRNISVRVGFSKFSPATRADVYYIPARESKQIVIRKNDSEMFVNSYIDKGYENRVECSFNERAWGEDDEEFYYDYDCHPGPGKVAITPDHTDYE